MFWKILIVFNALMNLYLTLHLIQTDQAIDHLYNVIAKGLEMARKQHGGGKHEKEALHDSNKG